MRMRFKPYARPELAAWPYNIDDPAAARGHWQAAFTHPGRPLRMEFGCGKGGFLAQLALRDREINFVGVDIKSEMLVVAKRTIEAAFAGAGQPVDNVLICAQELEQMGRIFAPEDETDRIYINFCNPWTKTGHAKHRLTHPRQLAQMREFLAENGEIWFKTDNDPLFEDSLRYFEYTGFEVRWLSRNLHADEPDWNLRTEHEKMFSEAGIPIKACIAVKRPVKLDMEAIRKLRNL